MDKYLEALKQAYEMMNTTDFGSMKKGCEALKVLEELVDQQIKITLSECIKEWGNRGFIVERKKGCYEISGFTDYQKEKFISIGVKNKKFVWLSYETLLSYEEVQLLSKTIKALEVEE